MSQILCQQPNPAHRQNLRQIQTAAKHHSPVREARASLKSANSIHNPMKRLILILNGKGGVGKSFFAVNFIQFLKDKGIVHVAIDSDNENSTLKRFHPDTRFLDLSKRRDLDAIFAALAKTNLVVVDCRAASTDLFIDFFNEIDLPAMLTAFDAKLTLVMPVNHESDSVDQIQRMTDEFKNRCNYVVVRNAAHSDSFAIFESSEVRALLTDKLGGREITMTRMQDWLVEALNAENLTISAATKHASFSLLDRQRIQTWQRKLFAEIESAANLLLPSK
jgi:hypothetical protein